jgi:hypothetical protein
MTRLPTRNYRVFTVVRALRKAYGSEGVHDVEGDMTANDQAQPDSEAFFERFRDDEAFAEACSSAASMSAAMALAATYGYTITPEALVHAATATRSMQHKPLLGICVEQASPFVPTDPGDY